VPFLEFRFEIPILFALALHLLPAFLFPELIFMYSLFFHVVYIVSLFFSFFMFVSFEETKKCKKANKKREVGSDDIFIFHCMKATVWWGSNEVQTFKPNLAH
jgi:hypothetical protein